MKKYTLFILLLGACLCMVGALEGYMVQKYHVEVDGKFTTIDLEYTKDTHNLMVVYTIKHMPFDEGDALIAIRDTVKKFAEENGYKSYKTYSDDIRKYGDKETTLTRFFILRK
jgi:hypothetical protein